MNPNFKKMLAARAITDKNVAARNKAAEELAAYRASSEGLLAEEANRVFQQEMIREVMADLNSLSNKGEF